MTEIAAHGAQALLGAAIRPLAASTFVATFTGVGLGREQARNVLAKEIHARFGKPRDSDTHDAHRAVVIQIVLIWEQVLLAARTSHGPLLLLPDGARVLAAADPLGELHALLRI
ncbi:hypothetical protein [Nocardia sp. NRRL S-836]|uniref:hypothetical protein n=1 Tax=Nocardia sp. NRRL S-836 TaxID=1519492 RepID=UPI0006AE7681|nr:hypothetical protein [Nocardia sp. NRRL S-836]KOV85322.1 hypothetical protein ADL03_14340 [Nocardia sp. NRRL S-836]